MLGAPRVIRRNMVRHEIEDQRHASPGKLSPGDGEPRLTSEMLVNHVASYAVGRADIVFRLEVRQSAAESVNQIFVLIGNRNPRRTSFPNPHQPDSIETKPGDGVPFGGGYGTQVNVRFSLQAELRKPNPGIDLV